MLHDFHTNNMKYIQAQDRDGINEAWLMNRFEYADTQNPITQSLYCYLGEVLNIPTCEVPKSHATE